MKVKQLPNRFLIVVVGPTAVGKTDLCVQIAKHFQTEIISADSRQYYQGMRIGTAQPTMEQRHQAVHHFIDCFPIDTFYSAGKFGQEALELIKRLFNKHQSLVLTGGSGLYIQAVCEGLDSMPVVPIGLRVYLNQRLQQEGLDALRQELARHDPAYYQVVDINNPQRIVRALEVCLATAKTYTEYRLQSNQGNMRPFKIIKVGLSLDRKLLYERIDQRVSQMVKEGLLEEVKALYAYKTYHALQAVGYQELFGYLDNQYNLEEAIELIKRNTRRYAKRQLTWFRKQADIQWFHSSDFGAIIKYIEACLENNSC